MDMEDRLASEDLATLLEKLKAVSAGDFSYAKKEEYSNTSIADTVNELLDCFMHRNNKYLIRINDAMTNIANSSCVKVMLDEIDSQQDAIKTLKEVKDAFSDSVTSTEESGNKIFALTKQVMHAMDDYGLQCRKALYIVNVLLGRGQLDMEQENSLLELSNNLKYQDEGLTSSSMRLRDMTDTMGEMFVALNTRAEKNEELFGAIDSITRSFDTMFTDCISVGEHLYRISRNIDNVRNDMFRQNSWPMLHDKLKIFTVDHLTLTWRLYNHVTEYETLVISQVNNPDGCKFGLWANSEMERDSEISKSDAFRKAVSLHYELHDHAVSCFLLKESFKTKEALSEFAAALETNERFAKAMADLHKYVTSIGIYDETEIYNL